MNVYKAALSALILAPIVGGISVHMIQNYMEMKEKAEALSAYSAEQVNQLEAMLADETLLNEAVSDAIEPDSLTEGIAEAVLRFHVRANSDSEEDQALKLLVRDQALRVDIGEHEGANWWCVMYPGLCFVETAGGVVATEGKEELKQVLTPEEYAQILVSPPENAEIEYRVFCGKPGSN